MPKLRPTIIAGCLIAITVALLLRLRAPDAFLTPHFFAEDLYIFWMQERRLGIAAFWRSYAGYLHLFPRSGAAITSIAPYAHQPVIYLALAVLGSVWTALTIATARLPVGLGIAFGIALFLVSHEGEAWARLTNIQWIMACALPVIAATRAPTHACARANQLAFTLVAGLSGPFAAFAIPLWLARLVRAWPARERFGFLIGVTGLVTGLVQAACVIAAKIPPAVKSDPDPLRLAAALIDRSALIHVSALGWVAGAALMAALLVAAVTAREGRYLRLALLGFAALIAVTVFVRFYRAPEVVTNPHAAPRYLFIQSVMVLWIAISLAWQSGRFARVAGIAAALIMTVRTPLPFARGDQLIVHEWPMKHHLIDKERVEIGFPPGWRVVINAKP